MGQNHGTGDTVRPEKLSRLLIDVATKLDQQDEINERILEQIAELNLRVRYLMERIKGVRASVIVGAPPDVVSLYDIYMSGDRDKFLTKIAGDNDARLQEILRRTTAGADARRTSDADRPRDASSTTGDAVTARGAVAVASADIDNAERRADDRHARIISITENVERR